MTSGGTAYPSVSVVELTTDLNTVVEQLTELGTQLRNGATVSGQKLCDHDPSLIDEIIATLRELDGKRHKAHELLEMETIKASLLRHRLANFPHKLKAEINALIMSARESNEAEMRRLQAELKQINEEADQSEKTQEVMELHNQVLEPEQLSLKSKYTEMVAKLNTCMGKKSKMQIKLNETRDKLNSTNQEIEQLESELIQLEHNMELARGQFTEDCEKLTQQTNEAEESYSEKKAENAKLSKRMEQLQSEVVETALAVSDKEKAVSELQAKIRQLGSLEDELKRRIEEEQEKTIMLEQSCEREEQEITQIRQEFATKQEAILDKTKLLRKAQESEAEKTNKLQQIKKGLRREQKQAQEDSVMQSRALKDIQANVGASKRTLLYQADEGARLEAETKDLSFKTAQLKESHEVNVKFLKNEISDMKLTMDKEKKTREVVEETYHVLQAQIEALKTEHATHMSIMASDTARYQKHHAEMCDKTTELEREIAELTQSNITISSQLSTATLRYNSMSTNLNKELEELQQNVADMADEIADRNETLSEIEPLCESLETDFNEKDAWYEKRKKDIIELKSKRSMMEDDIKTTKGDLEKIHIPQEKFRIDSLRCRAYTRQRLRERVVEVEDMEKRVAEAKKQLTAITNENQRIEKASNDLSSDIKRLTALLEAKDDIEEQLDQALKMYRSELSERWKENAEMDKVAAKRDMLVLNDLSKLKMLSQQRLDTITALHDEFDGEVQKFSNYLDTAATAKPHKPSTAVKLKTYSPLSITHAQ